MVTVAVLFARQDSIYKTLDGCDVFDIERDARTWGGGAPVIAHPPCRAWGRLRHFAKPRADEKELALYAVEQVRKFGGVLEHPEASSLWPAAGLPRPGCGVDGFGGWTLPVSQYWWGHRAMKATWLYIKGVAPGGVPDMPLVLGDAPMKVCGLAGFRKGMPGWRPCMRTAEREKTPPEFAHWLVELARRVKL